MAIKGITIRRIIIATGMAMVAICLIKAIKPLLPVRPGVTRENFDRVVKGMTKAEVEQIFGNNSPVDDRYGLNAGHQTMRWQWDANPDTVIIEFDGDGRVDATEWWNNVADENLFGMLCRMICLRPAAKSACRRLELRREFLWPPTIHRN